MNIVIVVVTIAVISLLLAIMSLKKQQQSHREIKLIKKNLKQKRVLFVRGQEKND